MSAAAPGGAVQTTGNAVSMRARRPWMLSGTVLCTSFLLCLLCVNEYRHQAHAKVTLQNRIKLIERQQGLVDRFHTVFTSMQTEQKQVPPVRVRWAERLQTALAGLQPAMVKFAIGDPEPIQTDLPDLAREATVFQYPVRFDSSLADDAQLMALLGILSGLQTELFENRGCGVKKQRPGSALVLNCLYSIYDIELISEGSQ